jgi:hypothetical protein
MSYNQESHRGGTSQILECPHHVTYPRAREFIVCAVGSGLALVQILFFFLLLSHSAILNRNVYPVSLYVGSIQFIFLILTGADR